MPFLQTTERKWKRVKDRQISGPCQRTKNVLVHEDDGDTSYSWCGWNNSQRLGKGTRRTGNQRKSKDHPDYSIVEISQNTQKSPEDLKRFAITQNPVNDYLQTLVWKTQGDPLRIVQKTDFYGLVSLFNGISTFVDYLMPKPFS